MELLVFPGPDQSLAHEITSVVSDVQSGHPTRYRLLAISHCHNLFALKGQQQQLMAFQLRPVSVFGPPAVEQASHVFEKQAFQLIG
jgi:hypothetical protein